MSAQFPHLLAALHFPLLQATHLSRDAYPPFVEAPYGVLVAMAHLAQDVGFWNLEKEQLFLSLTPRNSF